MRIHPALPILLCLIRTAGAQPADCAADPQAPAPAALPLELNLGGLPGMPRRINGQIYAAIPLAQGGMTCTDRRPPPRNVLRGEPGDVLHGPAIRP